MNIAIIPARGGSKRIKNKNSKIFFGKPIISYAISTALKSKIFQEVIVSTENKRLIDISLKAGAKVVKRPINLSKDKVPVIDVICHVLKKIKKSRIKPDFICCIFPVSPMIIKKILLKSLKILKKKN